MGKYIPVQTNHEIHGDVLVDTNDRTVTGLILPEIIKRKLGCIMEEVSYYHEEPVRFVH